MKNLIKPSIILLFFFVSLKGKNFSQNPKINYDSLINIWNNNSLEDSIRFTTAFNLVVYMTYEYPDSAFYYADAISKEGREKKLNRYIGWAEGLRGFIYEYQNQPIKALEYIKKAKNIYKKYGYKIEAVYTNNTLADMYREYGDFQKAHLISLENYKLGIEIKDSTIIVFSLLSLGKDYSVFAMTDSVIYCSEKCIEIVNLMKLDKFASESKAKAIQNLGHAYFKTDFDKSLAYFNESRDMLLKLNIVKNIIESYISIGLLYQYYNLPQLALENFLISQKMELDMYGEESLTTLKSLYKTYKKLNNFQKAIKINDKYLFVRDSSQNSSAGRELIKLKRDEKFSLLREIDSIKYSNEILINQAEAITQKQRNNGLIIISIIILASLVLVFIQLKELRKGKKIIEEKQHEISDSINYAKRIQDATMTSSIYLKEILPESFIFLKPKDVVSGDFYWTHKDQEENIFFTVADCTGHGIPGAFMSMIGISLLNDIIIDKKINDTGLILDNARESIIKSLNQEEKKTENKDGMDMAICKYDSKRKIIEYSGANNPLIHISGENINKIKSDSQPIGVYGGKLKSFKKNKIKVKEGDMLYLFSDGFHDQFGGEKGKKYMSGKFYKFLLSISKENIEKQSKLIENEFERWKGAFEQIDDICVMGVRV